MKQNQQIPSGYGECPVCHGTGWEIYRETPEGYKEPLEFTRRCSKCKGKRRINDQTGVPPEYCSADLTKFNFEAYKSRMENFRKIVTNFVNEFSRWEKQGKGLYLWSKTTGSGKTFLACCLARSLLMKYDLQMRFITAPDYISVVGDSYKRDRGELDSSEVYRECKLLVLDDIGAQADKDWQRQELFRLINKRMEDGNVTIYTSNMSTDNLNVDARTRDRIVKVSVELQMPEESLRRKKAEMEQNEFLKEVLP